MGTVRESRSCGLSETAACVGIFDIRVSKFFQMLLEGKEQVLSLLPFTAAEQSCTSGNRHHSCPQGKVAAVTSLGCIRIPCACCGNVHCCFGIATDGARLMLGTRLGCGRLSVDHPLEGVGALMEPFSAEGAEVPMAGLVICPIGIHLVLCARDHIGRAGLCRLAIVGSGGGDGQEICGALPMGGRGHSEGGIFSKGLAIGILP